MIYRDSNDVDLARLDTDLEYRQSYFGSSRFEAIVEEAMRYDAKVAQVDREHDPAVTAEQWDALTQWMGSRAMRGSVRSLRYHVGRHLAAATTLENELAILALAIMRPSDPLEYADLLSLSAFKRSEFLRDALGARENPHWAALIKGIQEEAQFRNSLAHGTWEMFDLRDDGSLATGWYLTVARRNRAGEWRLSKAQVAKEDFEERGRRVGMLAATVRATRHHALVMAGVYGEPRIPADLSIVGSTYPFDLGWSKPWFKALQAELFPPLVPA